VRYWPLIATRIASRLITATARRMTAGDGSLSGAVTTESDKDLIGLDSQAAAPPSMPAGFSASMDRAAKRGS
jgi:hypothetical protein